MRFAAIVAFALAVPLAACRSGAPPAAEHKAAPPAAATGAVQGPILETMESGGYTYLKLKTTAGEVWAAVPRATVKIGDRVELQAPMLMEGFHSKTLNRTFDRIYFAQLAGAGAAAGAGAESGALPPGHPPVGAAAAGSPASQAAGSMPAHPKAAPPAVDPATIKVAKAAGPDGRTVAELHAGRAGLKDQEVAVQGVVVRYNAGIMGRNWLHLRDGTGAPGSGQDDLTVTSHDATSVGAKVRVRGVVRLDRDFGAGYTYATIVEEAKVAPLP